MCIFSRQFLCSWMWRCLGRWHSVFFSIILCACAINENNDDTHTHKGKRRIESVVPGKSQNKSNERMNGSIWIKCCKAIKIVKQNMFHIMWVTLILNNLLLKFDIFMLRVFHFALIYNSVIEAQCSFGWTTAMNCAIAKRTKPTHQSPRLGCVTLILKMATYFITNRQNCQTKRSDFELDEGIAQTIVVRIFACTTNTLYCRTSARLKMRKKKHHQLFIFKCDIHQNRIEWNSLNSSHEIVNV